MHRYRIVAQISLIFSIFNLVLAAPIVVQGIHGARDDKAEGVPVMPNKSGDSEAASDRPTTSPPPSQDAMASLQHSSSSDGSTSSGHPTLYSDAIASPQHSSLSDGSTSSGHSTLYSDAIASPERSSLSDGSTSSGHTTLYSDAIESPQHSSLSEGSTSSGHPTVYLDATASSPHSSSSDGSASLHDLDSTSPRPISGPTVKEWLSLPPVPLPDSPRPSSQGSSEIHIPNWLQEWVAEKSQFPNRQPWSLGLTPQEIPSSMQRTGSDRVTMPAPHSTASEELLSSHHSSSDWLPLSLFSPPPSSPSSPDNASFFKKNRLKILTGAAIVTGVIGTIWGLEVKHKKKKSHNS